MFFFMAQITHIVLSLGMPLGKIKDHSLKVAAFERKIIYESFGFVSALRKKVFSGAQVKCVFLYGSNTLRVLIFAIFANFGQFREIKYPRNLYRDRIRENLYPRKKF